MIKKIISLASIILASGGVAFATTPTATPVTSATVTTNNDASYAQGNWNGFYVGAGLGYAFGNIETDLSTNIPNGQSKNVSDSFSSANPMAILGYSHTFDRLYLAGELDLGGFLGGDTSSVKNFGYNGTASVTASPTWYVAPSLLLGGLVTPKWLVYGRFGVPFVGMDTTQTITNGLDTMQHATNGATSVGVMGGVGVGYSFNRHINLRAEDDVSHTWGPSSSQPYFDTGLTTSSSVETTYNEVLVSFSYLF